jgi:hypothetical protein
MFLAFNMAMGIINVYAGPGGIYDGEVGRPLIGWSRPPRIGDDFIRLDNGTVVYANQTADYNATIRDVLGFDPIKSPGGSFEDTYGFFSFVIKGLRYMVNILIMPLVGFPLLLADFGVPYYFIFPITTLILIIVIIGMVEFLSNRGGVFS